MSGDYRRIEPGACTWCGHDPHDGQPCTRTIRTATSDTDPCLRQEEPMTDTTPDASGLREAARTTSHGDVEEFNRDCPIGTAVLAFPGSRYGRALMTRTRSTAWLVGREPVVMVEGYAGGIALTHIEVVPATPPADDASEADPLGIVTANPRPTCPDARFGRPHMWVTGAFYVDGRLIESDDYVMCAGCGQMHVATDPLCVEFDKARGIVCQVCAEDRDEWLQISRGMRDGSEAAERIAQAFRREVDPSFEGVWAEACDLLDRIARGDAAPDAGGRP